MDRVYDLLNRGIKGRLISALHAVGQVPFCVDTEAVERICQIRLVSDRWYLSTLDVLSDVLNDGRELLLVELLDANAHLRQHVKQLPDAVDSVGRLFGEYWAEIDDSIH